MFDIVQVKLRDFFTRSADMTFPVDNGKVFAPDPSWARTFAAGLQKCDLAGAVVTEVGVGSGINMAGLMLSPKPPEEFIGVDYMPSAVAASQWLAEREGIAATILESNLLGAISDDALRRTDYIIACIPQVVKRAGEIVNERDYSDYYEERGLDEDVYGLGLIASLLDESAQRAPHATLILNIANRPGGERIQTMFAKRGYDVNTVHAAVVQQDPTTSLASLARIEEVSGVDFHFYGDAGARERIQAQEAERRRAAGVPVYHNLHVLQAKLG